MQKHIAVISLLLIATAILGATASTGIQIQIQTAHANGELGKGSPDKEEFQISIRNIGHDDLLASVTIDGKTKKEKIDGNPSYIDAPTIQIVRFRFDRNENAGTPGVLPIKLGDEYTTCVSKRSDKSTGTCLRSTIDSITTPQTKNLYVDFIPDD